jgi:hypothetical protein
LFAAVSYDLKTIKSNNRLKKSSRSAIPQKLFAVLGLQFLEQFLFHQSRVNPSGQSWMHVLLQPKESKKV